jgi:hypothetical protein
MLLLGPPEVNDNTEIYLRVPVMTPPEAVPSASIQHFRCGNYVISCRRIMICQRVLESPAVRTINSLYQSLNAAVVAEVTCRLFVLIQRV